LLNPDLNPLLIKYNTPIGITLSVGFILQTIAVLFKPAKPDLSEMPIFFIGRSGSGAVGSQKLLNLLFQKKVVGFDLIFSRLKILHCVQNDRFQ